MNQPRAANGEFAGKGGGGKTIALKSNTPEGHHEFHKAIAEHLKSEGNHEEAAKHEKVAAKYAKKMKKKDADEAEDGDFKPVMCADCGQDAPLKYDGAVVYDDHSYMDSPCAGSGKTVAMRSDAVGVTVIRYDRSVIASAKRTQEGFLRIDGSKIARTGIQEYRRQDGSVAREFRDASEVFDAASMQSLALLPLTNTHPSKMLDPTNAKKHAVGSVGPAEKLDGKWLTAPISVWDADTIKAIESGRVQLSAGYSCQVVDEAGEFEGQKYDQKQCGITFNHLALVDVARAGPEARLKMDGSQEFDCDSNDMSGSKEEKETRMSHTLKVDGMTFEVNDPNAQAAVDRLLSIAKKDADEAATNAQAKVESAEKLRAEAHKNFVELQAKSDAATSQAKADAAEVLKLDGAEISFGDFRSDVAKRDAFLKAAIDKAAAARTALVIEAKKHLSANEKLDGLSDLDIKRKVIQKLSKDVKLDGKDDHYISVRYEVDVENASKNVVRPINALLVAATQPGSADVRADQLPSSDPEQARQAMVARMLASNSKNAK